MPRNPQSQPKQCWVEVPTGIILAIKAQPAARRTTIGGTIPAAPASGWPLFRLKISVAVPPENGKANEAILHALACHLQVKPAAISLQSGATARDKKFLVTGDPQALIALLKLSE